MAPHRGPQAERAVERRRRICEHLGLPFERMTVPEQIHSPHVLRVLPQDVGLGREGRHTAVRFVDGLICDLPGVPLMQLSADCPLVLVVSTKRRVFGMAHASWRGTVAGIAGHLVTLLKREPGVEPSELVAAICPCAGPEEYEIGEDVRRIVLTRLEHGGAFLRDMGGRSYFDLRAANAQQLITAGVAPEAVHIASESTMSDERFFSHRRDGAQTGRFGLIAGFRA